MVQCCKCNVPMTADSFSTTREDVRPKFVGKLSVNDQR